MPSYCHHIFIYQQYNSPYNPGKEAKAAAKEAEHAVKEPATNEEKRTTSGMNEATKEKKIIYTKRELIALRKNPHCFVCI